MYSFYQNLGQHLSVDIGKEPGKIIFYYTSHPNTEIIRKLSIIKMFINKNGKWGQKDLDIIRVKPIKKDGKAFFQVQSTERTIFIPKKAIEEKGEMMNIF